MNELKKGDFCGIYTRETGEPLFYTGIFDRMTDEDGRPCVFLATDPDNKNTFYRWTQSDLLKRGYYISKTGKNTIPRTAARLHIIFTHSGSLDGLRAIVEKDIYNRWIATTETGEQYMLFPDHIRIAAYCVILKTETAEEIENGDMLHPYQVLYIKKNLEAAQAAPEESTPATEANQDTTTGAQDGPTTAESNTAGENTTGADKAPEEATQRPKRRMAYIVECRSPRGSWTAYSAEQSTHEAAERIKEEAENRHALTPDGAPIFYRIVQIDKGPEQIMTPQEGPTTAGTTAANETPTAAETAPQEATTGPETSTATQDTTGSDTRPPRATEDATTGHAANNTSTPATAAGDISTPANQEPGTAAGAITGRTTTPPQNPGHACENATGRTERATPGQVHATHAKQPPRAAQRATTHGRPRGHPEKTANFGRFYHLLDFSRTIFANFQGIPISVCIFGPVFDPEFWRQKRHPPRGVSKSLAIPGEKNFQKIFLDGGKYNGKIHHTFS